ncbi:MAG: DUF4159 domain-containing protein [Flavobacteriales bacterium]|nr:DUF4159 domain-containing protein [Ulvibacter sp.]
MRLKIFYLFIVFSVGTIEGQNIAVLQYSGGGDWYSNPTSIANLVRFCNENIQTTIQQKSVTVTPNSIDIFDYPLVHMTGHGNVFFTQDDAKNLRSYLLSGGFLHIDDNYGMDQYLRKELIKIFPNKELKEIPVDHPIFSYVFNFPEGLPKIHEHNNDRPQAFGLYEKGRLMLLYTYESDLGDGWEDSEIHNDPESVRLKALRMGANIVKYAFEN